MSYTAEISRNNPGCFLFVIDQSGSMADSLASGKSKANMVADSVNRILQSLVIRCSKSEGIRDYFFAGIIGYGQGGGVVSAFEGSLSGKELVPISEIAQNPLEILEKEISVDDGSGGTTNQRVKFPIWLNPIADQQTPMREAFGLANKIVTNWLNQNHNCFPPIVIHITDGESTDGDPSQEMKALMSQTSADGNVLLFNVHLSSGGHTNVISFPGNQEGLPDDYAKMLFSNSSALIPNMIGIAKEDHGINLSAGARGFVFNGDLSSLVTALDIGTRASNPR